jgi:glutamate synthase (NADPH) large chain
LHLNQADEVTLKGLIANHASYTGSERAKNMLADWANYRAKFVKVMPIEYKRALTELALAASKEAA